MRQGLCGVIEEELVIKPGKIAFFEQKEAFLSNKNYQITKSG
jgi:hypothetical protein